jgi:hypothetical protein
MSAALRQLNTPPEITVPVGKPLQTRLERNVARDAIGRSVHSDPGAV